MAHCPKIPLVLSWFLFVLSVAWGGANHSEQIRTASFDISRDASLILYDGESTSLKCLPAKNQASNSSMSGSEEIQWTFPPDVNVIDSDKANFDLDEPWIEMTPSKTIVFHNPDKSFQAPYVCYNDKHRSTVWIKVLKRIHFHVGKNFIAAFIAVAVVCVVILIGYCAVKEYRRRKKNVYAVKKVQSNETEMIIPTIEIIDEKGEKLTQTVYDYV